MIVAALLGNKMILPLVLFIITYILLLIFQKIRTYIALGSALLFVVLGLLPLKMAFLSLDWNVLFMLIGTMGIVSLFIESKMPALLADRIIEKTPNVRWAVVALALFAGIISAFIDNAATVIMIAPIALTISKKLKISPVPSIIAIAVSSNLQGAATLVGDTTSIMLGKEAGMDFFDFFFFHGRPGIFWIVEIGAFISLVFLFWYFRKEKQPIEIHDKTEVKDYFPSVLLLIMIGLLIFVSFFPNKPHATNGFICLGIFLIGLIYKFIRTLKVDKISSNFRDIDFHTVFLLAGIFVLVGALKYNGIIEKLGELISHLGGGNVFLVYTVIVWASVFISAFIDNIPYVAIMLPVVTTIASNLGIAPFVLYYGLLIGATLGGNLTPIGASANIAGLGILRKEGYEVNSKTFMKIGVPFTLLAVITGYILVWFIWYIR